MDPGEKDASAPISALAAAVGGRIKHLRQMRGFTLSELARRASLGKGTLSELESGRRNPTLETLYSLTEPLGVGLADLLEPARVEGQVVVPGEATDPVQAVLLDVVDTVEGARVEIYRLTLTGHGTRRSPSHGIGVIEQLTIISGTAVVGPVGRERTIGTGETATWVSDTEHSFRATGGPAVGVLVITGPTALPGAG